MVQKQKVVYITGGSKGIGKGIALFLVGKGYKVALSSRKLDAAKLAANDIDASGENVLALQSEVGNLQDEQNAVQKIIEKWGQLDVLVANAGVGHFADFEDLTAAQWNETINTNLTGVFNTCKAGLSAIKKAKGYIFTIASLAGTNFFEKGTAYNASKFGLVGFSQALMLDVRPDDVKVSTIMPGSVASHFNNHQPNSDDYWKIQPEDIGQLLFDLLQMNPRTLPSKVEVRPSKPPQKKGATNPFDKKTK